MLTKGKLEQGYDYISLQRQLETEQDAYSTYHYSSKKLSNSKRKPTLSFRVAEKSRH